MANEKLFTTKAANYAQARPGYAEAAIEYLMKNLLHPGDVVADIGSGTGIFSKQLIEKGFEVYCVEPNEAMRTNAENMLSSYPNFHSVPAPAEDTGLKEHSISLVTAASAFHWFDTERFRKECNRILTADGQVCILLNVRVYDEFTIKQHELCESCCPKFKSLTHGLETTRGRLEEFFEHYQTMEFDLPLSYSKDKFIIRSLSSSYAPELGTDNYEVYAEGLRKLLDESIDGDTVTITNKTVMIWGTVK